MTHRSYSSIEAFLTHWRTLRAASARSASDRSALGRTESELLRAMEHALEALTPAERALLESGHEAVATLNDARGRRLQRATTKLVPILTATGWIK